MTIEALTPETTTDVQRAQRLKVRRALEALQRTRIDHPQARTVLGMVASLHRTLGTIDANEALHEDRVVNVGDDSFSTGYNAGFAAALGLIGDQITDEVR